MRKGSALRFVKPVAAIAAACAFSLAACGKPHKQFDPEAGLSASCKASPEQRRSFMAKAREFPIRILVDTGFDEWQYHGVLEAAREWNVAGRRLIGGDFFTVTRVALPPAMREVDPRDCNGVTFGTPSTLPLLRVDDTRIWAERYGFGSGEPGGTLRCFDEGSGLVTQQLVGIFVPSTTAPQFASVVTHELGHALGLNHSCNDDAPQARFVSCGQVPGSHPYRESVMFPTLYDRRRDGSIDIKQRLTENDLMRLECLYGP